MAKLEPGFNAPVFDLKDQDGKRVRSGDFRGKKIFLFFYPKAGTKG